MKLFEQLNISPERVNEIDDYILNLSKNESALKSDDLKKIKEKYKENELIYAAYSYGYYWGINDSQLDATVPI